MIAIKFVTLTELTYVNVLPRLVLIGHRVGVL